MKVLDNIEIIDLALKYKDILVIGDLHLGLEGSFVEQGIMLPVNQLENIMEKLKKIINKAKPKIVVINGDLKEEFGTILNKEWEDTTKLIDYLKQKAKIILIKGNHDTILAPIAKRYGLPLEQRYDVDDISIVHGDVILKNLRKTIIIGHEHPAISFKERPDEKYKCFLVGKYKKHRLIVMPSFNLLFEGSDVMKEGHLSPYIKDISNFNVYVVQDKVYNFGKLRDL